MIRYIYTFFMGLLLSIFIGTGIAAFYQAPKEPEPPAWYGRSDKAELSQAEKNEEATYNRQYRTFEHDMQDYNRTVSIIVLSCAIIILIIALLLSDRFGAIADGLLLGGIFTLLYGIGRGVASGSDEFRFVVSSIGLAVAITLGYIKFARSAARPVKQKPIKRKKTL